MFNDGGIIIGNSDFGFSTQEECKSLATKSINSNLICSWNGSTYQIFNFENGLGLGITDIQFQYNDSADCIKDSKLQPSQSGFVCLWNGKNYSVYNRTNNIAASGALNGWSDIKECLKGLSKNLLPLACGWDNGSYLYNLEGEKISPTLSISISPNGYSCNSLIDILGKKVSLNKSLPKINLSQDLVTNKKYNPNEKIGLGAWKDCEIGDLNFHILSAKNGYVTPECAPDTLFSWGDFSKLNWFINNLSKNGKWIGKFQRPVFSTLSPASTFGYGVVPIRLKIKETTKFKFLNNPQYDHNKVCQTISKNSTEISSTIFVRYANIEGNQSLVDYIICSSDVIDSWSFYTPQHYLEIMRDYTWNTGPDYKLYNTYLKNDGRGFFLNSNLDSSIYGTDFSSQTFIERMNFFRWGLELNLGEIFAPNNNQKAVKTHFQTKTQNYFNWNEPPAVASDLFTNKKK